MTADLSSKLTLSNLVIERPERSKVLERFGLDFCCGGKRTLADACEEKGIDPVEVLKELYEEDHKSDMRRHLDHQADWSAASMTALVDHIEQTHHQYTKAEIARIGALVKKVAERHGDKQPYLYQLRDMFFSLSEQMLVHMMKEETVLFPMVKQLETAKSMPRFHCGTLANPVRVMEFEHEEAGELMKQMRQVTLGYELPENACNSYRALYSALDELEKDLHVHVHKENYILFPKALKAEHALQGGCCGQH